MDSYFQDKELHGLVTKHRLHQMNQEIINTQYNYSKMQMNLMLVRSAHNVGRVENWKPYRIYTAAHYLL